MPCTRRRLTVGTALAAIATASPAQGFDPGSTQVQQAYEAPLSADKLEAARAGLTRLLWQASHFPSVLPNPPGTYTSSGSLVFRPDPYFFFIGSGDFSLSSLSYRAGNDADLAVLGNPVVLSDAVLTATASFSTARNFRIGPLAATIDTAGHDLTITGVLTADAVLKKQGNGTLALTGDNVWRVAPWVSGGTLKGNSRSLRTTIVNLARVEFAQDFDGDYGERIQGSGVLIKSGGGTLTLTAEHSDFTGATIIDAGVLALRGAGALNGTGSLDVRAGAIFDLSAASGNRQIGVLTGAGAVVLGPDNLTAVNGQNSVFAGSLSGSGRFVKAGGGTLTLTGNNSHTGGTRVAVGTLALAGAGRLAPLGRLVVDSVFDIAAADGNREVASLEGASSGQVVLGANTLTFGGNNEPQLFAGTISGSGGLTKIGSGTFTLTGYSQHRGLTTIEQGTVVARPYSLGPRILNHGTLVLEDRPPADPATAALPAGSLYSSYATVQDYSGSIGGTGQLIKAGRDVIWLRGENSYRGGTRIDDGVLIGNDRSLPGDIVNNAGLAFYQSADGEYAGKISGSGLLLKYGPGNLTLSGLNSHGGGTVFSGLLTVADDRNLGASSAGVVIADGTLRLTGDIVSARAFGLAEGGGTFDTGGHILSLQGPIVGTGTLTKIGAGTLEVTGTAAYTGATTVGAGTLKVSGSLQSTVTVAAGATLSGSGSVGGIVAHGRIAPDAPNGALTITGNAALLEGSTLQVATDPQGRFSSLLADSATLRGTTLAVDAQDGRYPLLRRYAVLRTANGISGRFDTVSSNLAFLQPELDYDGSNVYLQLRRNQTDYGAVAQTPLQTAVARSLDRLAGTTGSDVVAVIDAVDGLTAPQARAAFDTIGGTGRVATTGALHYGQRSMAQQTFARLGVAEAAGRGDRSVALESFKLAFDGSVASDAPPLYAAAFDTVGVAAGSDGADNGWWLRGYDGRGRLAAAAGADDARLNFAGVLVGYDRQITDNWRLGVLASYAKPRLEQDSPAVSSRMRSTRLGLYGRYRSGPWRVDAMASAGTSESWSKRTLMVGGLSRVAQTSYDGHGEDLHIEAAYALRPAANLEIEPFLGLQWSRQRDEAYLESGAGILDLAVNSQNSESLRSTLGLRTARSFDLRDSRVTVEGRLAWGHEFRDRAWFGARLASDLSGQVFKVAALDRPRNSLLVGLGVSAEATRSLRLYVDLASEFNGGEQVRAISFGLRYHW